MKPQYTINPTRLENRDQFTDPFFQRFTLHECEEPLPLNEHVHKSYLFPTLYSNVTCAIGIFFCSYEKATQRMLHPKMKPIHMAKDRSLVIFSSYAYKHVLGIPSYNEIAMTIPVMVGSSVNPPLLPMLFDRWFSTFGYYVFSMPVTSLENQIRGEKIWGLPKVVEEIAIKEDEGHSITTATAPEEAIPYFTLSIPTTGKKVDFDVRSALYSKKECHLLKSETYFKAPFQVNKNMGRLLRSKESDFSEALTLANTPRGRALQEMDIDPIPFQTRYATDMNSCFHLPDPSFTAPFTF